MTAPPAPLSPMPPPVVSPPADKPTVPRKRRLSATPAPEPEGPRQRRAPAARDVEVSLADKVRDPSTHTKVAAAPGKTAKKSTAAATQHRANG